jgi:hypothetical protein
VGDHSYPGETSARGYGSAHQKLRARWRIEVDAGRVDCARCGKPIVPGTPWDLGHDDESGRQAYRGPEHRICNRRAGQERGGRGRGFGDPRPRVSGWWRTGASEQRCEDETPESAS